MVPIWNPTIRHGAAMAAILHASLFAIHGNVIEVRLRRCRVLAGTLSGFRQAPFTD